MSWEISLMNVVFELLSVGDEPELVELPILGLPLPLACILTIGPVIFDFESRTPKGTHK